MEQMSMFDYFKTPLKIDKPIRLIELFAGIGSQAKALKRLGANFEHYRVCEFDKYAIKSYNAIHRTDFEISNIMKITAEDLGIVDTDKYCYIMTYSFPCQDLSLAGKQKGMGRGKNTRSSLLWEVERLLNECEHLPQVLLMENVPQVHGKKNIEHFGEWIRFLESKGYSNYWKDLNAKNFGIPQNRNRTFMVSVLGEYTYEFPKEFPLVLRLKDLLEDVVDKIYYLTTKQLNYAIDLNNTQKGTRWEGRCDAGKLNPCVAMTLGVRSAGGGQRVGVSNFVIDNIEQEISVKDFKDSLKPKVLGGIGDKKSNGGKQWYQQDRIYDDCVAISLATAFNPYYAINEPTALDEQNGFIRKDGTIGTLTTDRSSPKHNNRVIENKGIRRLTPRECWRLMGFDDADFDKAAKFNSNAQLYKQAGNSIVVDVLYYIFKEMLV